jgi:hypothetical protein
MFLHTCLGKTDASLEFTTFRPQTLGAFATPSTKSTDKVKDTLRDLFKSNVSSLTQMLVIRANRVIRAWAISKRSWECFASFKAFDDFL